MTCIVVVTNSRRRHCGLTNGVTARILALNTVAKISEEIAEINSLIFNSHNVYNVNDKDSVSGLHCQLT